MSADLHLHTNYSDGNWTPSALIEAAYKLGFSHIAISDHDTTAGIEHGLEAASGRLEIIPAIEINSIYEGPNEERLDVHILGYFIDPTGPSLKQAILKQRQARIDYINNVVALLKADSHKLEADQVYALAPKGSVGRPHLSMAMVAANICQSVSEAYRLLMSKDSPYFLKRQSISTEEAINAIRDSGGIASIAHPGKDKRMDTLVPELKALGLGAIEVYHRGHNNKLVRRYQKMARDLSLAISGGSDCHGPYENFPATLGEVRVPISVVLDLKKAKR